MSRLLRAFPKQPKDPDEAAKEVGAVLDATGCPFLVLVRVGPDVRVAGGPQPQVVVELVRAIQSMGTLEKVAEEFSRE
jgi:hypothetical protein